MKSIFDAVRLLHWAYIAIITGATNSIANVLLLVLMLCKYSALPRKCRKKRKITQELLATSSSSSSSSSCSCFCSVHHFASVFHFYVYLVILCNYLTFMPLFTHHRLRRLDALLCSCSCYSWYFFVRLQYVCMAVESSKERNTTSIVFIWLFSSAADVGNGLTQQTNNRTNDKAKPTIVKKASSYTNFSRLFCSFTRCLLISFY